MSAIVPDYYSAELTTVNDPGNAKLAANVDGGRMRIKRFTRATGAGIAQNKYIDLCRLPKGARILRLFTTFGAMGASATMEIGLRGTDGDGTYDGTNADASNLLASGVNVAAAGESTDADTIALNYGYETLKEVTVVAKTTGAAWAASKNLIGHIEYVVD